MGTLGHHRNGKYQLLCGRLASMWASPSRCPDAVKMQNPQDDNLFASFLLKVDYKQVLISWVWGNRKCNFYEDGSHASFISMSPRQPLSNIVIAS